ncbi:uncharacterized protein LOC116428482 [Nomia melanderi]|uniref:uncharacterized protein LOC116428482 n=1 Tax=Nomia melanderi TaxID=2448451 RepID=UPI0013042D5C|nr:uncharacterized protein LOC116428482 [Nomia melanderi]
MDALKYAQEFTTFLSRWTRPVLNADGSSTPPLTNQQLYNTTQDVLKVMLGMNIQMPDYSSMHTPSTKIAVCTPSAPYVSKSNLELINTSLGRSLDTLTAIADDNNGKTEVEESISKSQEKLNVEENSENKLTPNEKKFISRSSPAIHVTCTGKSGTFVLDDETETGAVLGAESSPFNLEKISKIMDSVRANASDIISKMDDIRKDLFPQQTKPIRRLSSIGTNRSTTLTRPNPPPKLRRSSSVFTGTPTSSKLSTTEQDSIVARRKSLAVGSLSINQAKSSPANRSPSVAGTAPKKLPLAVGKPLKNPKYAHVQSTIPKSSSSKKNTQ